MHQIVGLRGLFPDDAFKRRDIAGLTNVAELKARGGAKDVVRALGTPWLTFVPFYSAFRLTTRRRRAWCATGSTAVRFNCVRSRGYGLPHLQPFQPAFCKQPARQCDGLGRTRGSEPTASAVVSLAAAPGGAAAFRSAVVHHKLTASRSSNLA